jgi:hypothetical protein
VTVPVAVGLRSDARCYHGRTGPSKRPETERPVGPPGQPCTEREESNRRRRWSQVVDAGLGVDRQVRLLRQVPAGHAVDGAVRALLPGRLRIAGIAGADGRVDSSGRRRRERAARPAGGGTSRRSGCRSRSRSQRARCSHAGRSARRATRPVRERGRTRPAAAVDKIRRSPVSKGVMSASTKTGRDRAAQGGPPGRERGVDLSSADERVGHDRGTVARQLAAASRRGR